MKKTRKRVISFIITVCMLVGMLPTFGVATAAEEPAAVEAAKADNAGKAVDVYVAGDRGRIGNIKNGKGDNFADSSYYNRTPGFRLWVQGGAQSTYISGTEYRGNSSYMVGTISVADNEALRRLAESGNAKMSVWMKFRGGRQKQGNQYISVSLSVTGNGKTLYNNPVGWNSVDWGYINTGDMTFYSDTVIRFSVASSLAGKKNVDINVGIFSMSIYFWDYTCPELTYTSTYNTEASEVSQNTATGNNELLLKLGTSALNNPEERYSPAATLPETREYVDFAFKTSKIVTAENAPNIEITESESYKKAKAELTEVTTVVQGIKDLQTEYGNKMTQADNAASLLNGMLEEAESKKELVMSLTSAAKCTATVGTDDETNETEVVYQYENEVADGWISYWNDTYAEEETTEEETTEDTTEEPEIDEADKADALFKYNLASNEDAYHGDIAAAYEIVLNNYISTLTDISESDRETLNELKDAFCSVVRSEDDAITLEKDAFSLILKEKAEAVKSAEEDALATATEELETIVRAARKAEAEAVLTAATTAATEAETEATEAADAQTTAQAELTAAQTALTEAESAKNEAESNQATADASSTSTDEEKRAAEQDVTKKTLDYKLQTANVAWKTAIAAEADAAKSAADEAKTKADAAKSAAEAAYEAAMAAEVNADDYLTPDEAKELSVRNGLYYDRCVAAARALAAEYPNYRDEAEANRDAMEEPLADAKEVLTARNTVYEAEAAQAENDAASKIMSSGITGDIQSLLKHTLFTNTLGTGYAGMGQNRGLELYRTVDENGTERISSLYLAAATTDNPVTQGSSATLLQKGKYIDEFAYRYTVQRGDFSGNSKIKAAGGIETLTYEADDETYEYTDASGAVTTLLQKIANAGFHDAAGNPLVVKVIDKPDLTDKTATSFNVDNLSEIVGKNTTSTVGGKTVKNVEVYLQKSKSTGKYAVCSTNWEDWAVAGNNLFSTADEEGGYDVIVDGEPPTYTKVGNGISPDILTSVTLNKNDEVDFIVSFSEAVRVKPGFDTDKTYILFNNGARAYFKETSADGKQMVFSLKIGAEDTETSLWKAIALTNEALDGDLLKGSDGTGNASLISGGKTNDARVSFYVDGRVIVDYAGNILAERANEDATTNTSQIESSTSWAKLSVDNTSPEISFEYKKYAAAMTVPTEDSTVDGKGATWGQAGKIYVVAKDPDIPTPLYDPDQTYEARPSKGIFRPDNTTSSGDTASSPTGLIFYVWSQDENAPDVGENYEVIKRFSLVGWDETAAAMTEEADSLYASWKGLTLTMANNYGEIVPPDEALEAENSGRWYLHVWTADMTWDSARQLMQYDMMYALKFNEYVDEEEPENNTGKPYTTVQAQTLKSSMIESQRSTTVGHLSKLIYSDGSAVTEDNWDKLSDEEKQGYEDAWNSASDEDKIAATETALAKYSNNDAWLAIAAEYQEAVYTAEYRALLEQSGKDVLSDDAETYARNETMKKVGNYGDTDVWTLDKFRNDDSNWVYKSAYILFDNAEPEITVDFDGVEGDATASVRLTFRVTEKNSGIDTEKVYYQWVLKTENDKDSRSEESKNIMEWISADSEITDRVAGTGDMSGTAQISVTVPTQGHVDGDGKYYLSVKVVDVAGNEAVYHSEQTVTVNSTIDIHCIFSQTEDDATYYKSVSPNFRVDGIKVGDVKYAITSSMTRPDESQFTLIANSGADDTDFDKFYQLDTIGSEKADGSWYIHVLVYENAIEVGDPYYFYSVVKLDNTEPSLYMNPLGSNLEKEEYTVNVTASDVVSGLGTSFSYQWTKENESVDEANWTNAAIGTAIGKKVTDKSETGSYYLHVRITDNVGNTATVTSDVFRFKFSEPIQIAHYESRLLTVYTDDADEGGHYYGVAQLTLEEENKDGFRYSVTNDGGKTWSNWKTFSSMVEMSLPTVTDISEVAKLAEGTLAVKFKAPDGTLGNAVTIATNTLDTESGVWTTATPESLQARTTGTELALLMNHPTDVTVTIDTEKNTVTGITEDAYGDFIVKGNGVYNFKLTKGEATADFCIVIDIYDDEKPEGFVNYSEIAPTNVNVTATLETNEAVNVTKIRVYDKAGQYTEKTGSDKYVFTENGKIEFVFRDAAGNENTAVAKVENIDREAPDVEIVVAYTDGTGTQYDTYVNGKGETISHGMFLSLAKTKDGNQKDFTIVSGNTDAMLEVTENGRYSYTVQDNMGNVRVVTKNVTTIADNSNITPTVEYRYEQAENAGLDPNKDYKNDNVVVTISIPAPTDGRKIYLGRKITAGAEPLDKENGNFVLIHTYSVNGEKTIYFNDGIGGVIEVPIKVTGIDKTRPSITLNSKSATLKIYLDEAGTEISGEALVQALGGYVATDAETPDMLTVTLTDIDDKPITLSKDTLGVYTVRYAVVDGAGNDNFVDQTVYVISGDDLFVTADDALLANAGNNTAIVPTNHVSFTIDEKQMQQMFYRGKRAYNRAMRYDVYYVSGLYREGQLKYIATKLTGEELANSEFNVTFEKSGWYTIIIRNQERNRVYTTFFVSSVE